MRSSDATARAVGAAAEPEQEHAIALLEVIHQKYVRVANVGLEPVAEGSGRKPREDARYARQRARRLHRPQPGMVIGHLARRIGVECEVQLDDVGAVPRNSFAVPSQQSTTFFGIEISRSRINGRVSRPRKNQFARRHFATFTNRSTAERGKPRSARRKMCAEPFHASRR